MKTFLAICCLVIITSCKKKEFPVIPDASMYADKTQILKGDTVLFTNTSIADYAAIYISRSGEEEQGVHTGYSFTVNNTNTYKHIFSDTGNFSAILQVNNEGSSIRMFKIPVIVKP
jgi:hypothetical protein